MKPLRPIYFPTMLSFSNWTMSFVGVSDKSEAKLRDLPNFCAVNPQIDSFYRSCMYIWVLYTFEINNFPMFFWLISTTTINIWALFQAKLKYLFILGRWLYAWCVRHTLVDRVKLNWITNTPNFELFNLLNARRISKKEILSPLFGNIRQLNWEY